MSFIRIKKDLHLGKCLDDLKEMYEIPKNHQQKSLPLLLNTCKKLVEHGDRAYLEGDEETSYVFYMKFFNLFHVIRNRANTPSDKALIKKNKNDKNVIMIMDKLEELSNSLRQRYQQLKPPKELTPVITIHRPTNVISSNVPSPSDFMKSMSKQMDDLDMETPEENKFFTIKEFYTKLTDRSFDMLILDCRPRLEYQESHVNYLHCLNIAEEMIVHGLSGGKLQSMLTADDRNLFTLRSVKNFVVLMDWDTNSATLTRGTPIWSLQSALEYDLDVQCQKVMFLRGGYKDFLLTYPTICTNPMFTRFEPEEEDDGLLDKIEYESIEEIPMKDKSFSSPLGVPQVNRSTKTAAVKLYEGKKPNLEEVLEKEEKLADKTLNIEKEILNTETDYMLAQQKMNASTDEKSIEENESKQQELRFKLLQLNDNRNEYQNELEIMQSVHKDLVAEEPLDQEQIELEMEKNRLIKEKEEEAKRLAKKREDMARRREEHFQREKEAKLAFSREQKKRLNATVTPLGDDQVPYNTSIPKPEIPKIDRSAKPPQLNYTFADLNHNIQRHFSPIYGCPARGLTGLKNLGNTCYMNSIIQCLSNTNRLTEYFVTGKYQKHFNVSSKTQGKIALEVSAVVCALWNGQYKSIASSDLRYCVGEFQKSFRGTEQQDSHEFLTILMDWLHLDLQTIYIPEPKHITPSDKAWLEFTKHRESFILQLFYGQIKSTVKCVQCGKESATYESFSNLSLELPSYSNRCEIVECLNMYFHGERISGWNCPQCKVKREAVKKLDISRLPPVLVMHFKRFHASDSSLSYRKKMNFVSYPITNLDMTQYVTKSELKKSASRSYNLYAVSNHYGSMESGHYTAFGKNVTTGKWYKFDDSAVSSISDSGEVKSGAAYILFYTTLPDFPIPEIKSSY